MVERVVAEGLVLLRPDADDGCDAEVVVTVGRERVLRPVVGAVEVVGLRPRLLCPHNPSRRLGVGAPGEGRCSLVVGPNVPVGVVVLVALQVLVFGLPF